MRVNDLTTTRSPFIEEARSRGTLFIEQPYRLYSETNQQTWRTLYGRMEPLWDQYANEMFNEGLGALPLNSKQIPRIQDVNRALSPLSGFKLRPVSGYVPAFLFFDCLRRREFPTTITIRDASRLEYLPEPDIFHDLAGHVPMHTDRTFSDVLVRFGEVSHRAAGRVSEIMHSRDRAEILESIIKAMARFFWFTVEFGLMKRQDGSLCVYGSGLLSSMKEIQHSIESPQVQRHPFHFEWVVNQYFEIDHLQPLLFVIDSFGQLFEEIDRLERWILGGKLDRVSPGEPLVDKQDLQSFLDAA